MPSIDKLLKQLAEATAKSGLTEEQKAKLQSITTNITKLKGQMSLQIKLEKR